MIDDNSKEFIKRHIGPSEEEQSKMLKYIGYKSLQDLMENTVPEKILLKEDLKIDQPMSENDALKKLGLSFITGGALGNIVDRAPDGYVTDFLHLHIDNFSFFIFNFADASISLGAILIIYLEIFKKDHAKQD